MSTQKQPNRSRSPSLGVNRGPIRQSGMPDNLKAIDYIVFDINPSNFSKSIDNIKDQNVQTCWSALSCLDQRGDKPGAPNKLPTNLTLKLSFVDVPIFQVSFQFRNVPHVKIEFQRLDDADRIEYSEVFLEENLLQDDDIFEENGKGDLQKKLKKTIKAEQALKMPKEKFNTCILTIKNTYYEIGYEADFEVVYFQLKATKDDYDKALEALKKKAKKPYPTQQRVPATPTTKA